jgi:hypothetical protein
MVMGFDSLLKYLLYMNWKNNPGKREKFFDWKYALEI